MWSKFNLNENVRVKLTDFGRKIHRLDFDTATIKYGIPNRKYVPPVEDKEGWSTWQLWVLIKKFGQYSGIGTHESPFDLNIEFIQPDVKADPLTEVAKAAQRVADSFSNATQEFVKQYTHEGEPNDYADGNNLAKPPYDPYSEPPDNLGLTLVLAYNIFGNAGIVKTSEVKKNWGLYRAWLPIPRPSDKLGYRFEWNQDGWVVFYNYDPNKFICKIYYSQSRELEVKKIVEALEVLL